MEYYIYIKENGKTTRVHKNMEKEKKAIQPSQMNALSILQDYSELNIAKSFACEIMDVLDYCEKSINNRPRYRKTSSVTDNINYAKVYNDSMDLLIKRIVTIKTKEDILDLSRNNSLASVIIKVISDIYVTDNVSKGYIDRVIKAHKELSEEALLNVYHRIIKDVIRRFLKKRVDNLSNYKANSQREAITSGTDALSFVYIDDNCLIDLEDEVLKKFIKVVYNHYLRMKTLDSRQHLCFDCPVDLLDCPKIMDDPCKKIYQYPFITDGV